jgi:Tol biopolymer transport system component
MPRLSTFSSRPQRRAARGPAVPAAVSQAAFETLEDRRLLSVSIVSNGTAAGNGTAREPSVSADGRYVVFSSSASNLVAGDANNVADVFLRDTTNNTTTLISVAKGSTAPGNGKSEEPSISADGRFVSFTSLATDLVDNDGNALADIFVRDVQAGTTRRVSTDATGTGFSGNSNGFSAEPYTSANGDFVGFTSRADDMVTGVTDRKDFGPNHDTGVTDVFLRDLTSNNPGSAIKMISVTPAGNISGNGRSFDPSVSADGRFVAFRSEASDLVTGDNNGKRDIFVRDMQSGVTTRVSVATGGGESNGDSDSPSISQDGRFVVFSSLANNLGGNDTNGDKGSDVFIHDTQTHTTTLVSANQLRTASGNGVSFEPTISQEGRFVAFTSSASDLVTSDNNNSSDIFLYDVTSGALTLVSLNTAGRPAQGNSRDAFVAPGGQFIAFSSEAIDLVGGDNNGASDAFLAGAPNRTEDTQAPTAALSAVQPSNFLGANHLDFSVTYNDDDAVNINSIGDGDVEITPPTGGSPVAATLVSQVGSGKTVQATYRIPVAAAGGVSAADNGAYAIALRSGQVQDAAGNSAAAGPVGTGSVNVTAVPAEGADIVVTIPGAIVPAVAGFKGKQKVLLQNTGTQAIATKSKITVGLFLSNDSLLDSSDVPVGAPKLIKFNAKPNARPKPVAFKFLWPTPSGSNTGFQLLAAADTTNVIPERSEENNVAASPVTLAPPFVDLSGSLGAIPATLAAGQRVRLPFTIQNNGNVPAKGTISLKLLASADDEAGTGDSEIVTLIKRINLRPGKPKLLPLSFVMPSTIAAGDYKLLVQIDSGSAITETNEVNNVVASEKTFHVG